MARKTVIGLDIGTSAVRAAELDVRKSPPLITRFGQVMLPIGAVHDGEVVDAEAVGATISELWKRAHFKSKHVLLGVANQRVIVRQVEMPWMEEDELRQGLAFQVQDQLPIPVADAILDFRVLEEFVSSDNQQMMRVLLVAAQRGMIDAMLRAVSSAGLKPDVIDLVPFALMRTLGDLSADQFAQDPSQVGSAEAIIDVGAGITNIVVHEQGTPRFVRILVSGGQEVTDALASGLGLPVEEAEAIKRQAAYGGASEEAVRIVDEQMRVVVDEIRGSLEYYENQPTSGRLARVVLTGGASVAPTFAQDLQAATGVPTTYGHPLASIRLGKLGLTPEQLAEAENLISVPVGLALGERQ